MHICSRLIVLVSLLSALAVIKPRELMAHPFDTYGFTSRSIAMGGSATAGATDVDAAYYNPAAAVRTRSFVLATGLLLADEFLRLSDGKANLKPLVHYQLGLATPIPLGRLLEDRLFATVAASLPHDGLYDVRQPEDEALTFPFWDARNRRLVLTAGVAGRVTSWLSLGVGFSLLPNVKGEVEVDLLGSRSRNSTRVQVEYNFAPTAGVLVTPLSWLTLGLTYRGGHATSVSLPVDVSVSEGFPPIAARIAAPAYSVPHQVAFGAGFDIANLMTITVDVTWYGYRSFDYSSPDVTLYDSDGGIVRESLKSAGEFADVFVPRAGLEWHALSWLAVRGGYAFVMSPVGYQSGVTNLLDAHRSVISTGVGFVIPRALLWDGAGGLEIDLHAQLAVLWRRGFEKHSIMVGNPGYPTIEFSGGTYSFGLSARLWF